MKNLNSNFEAPTKPDDLEQYVQIWKSLLLASRNNDKCYKVGRTTSRETGVMILHATGQK